MLYGLKIWAIILTPILLLTTFCRIKLLVDGDVNHLMNASNKMVTVTFISENDGKDYEFVIEPESDMTVRIKKDVYHFIVENQEDEELRNVKSFSLETLDADERYIDLLGDHVYFVMDFSLFYLKSYEDPDSNYLDKLFDDETYKEIFYGDKPFYLDTNTNTQHYSFNDEIPLEIDSDEKNILILPFEREKFESLTVDDLVIEAINYVFENLEKE